MVDISAAVDPIVAEIYKQYEKTYGSEPPRTYLGASIIGKECARALWYDFRWGSREEFDGRMYRLFQTGHLAEPRFIADLRAIGCDVHAFDPTTGEQFGFSDHGGHMKGHMDGCANGIPGGGQKWHVTEYKTHSDKSFKALKKDGLEKAKPQHYAQKQWYMGQSGMERGLYLAVNKDTDELYAERIKFDPVYYERLQAKAVSIIFASEPPARLSNDPKFYQCNWCSHNAVCHGNRVPAVSCRTCVHSTPERDGDGRWSCAKAGADSSIPIEVQRTGCPEHLPLPFLLTYADAIDAGDGWIQFQRKDNGAKFAVTTGKVPFAPQEFPLYSSAEISAAKDHRAICNPEIEKLRTEFGGTICG